MVRWAQGHDAEVGSGVREVVNLDGPRAADIAAHFRDPAHVFHARAPIVAGKVCLALGGLLGNWLARLWTALPGLLA
jgi:hypothetical protein